MSELFWLISLALVVLLWLKTGRSPFIWVAWLMLHCEAARAQFFQTLRFAWLHFSQNWRKAVIETRAEVGW